MTGTRTEQRVMVARLHDLARAGRLRDLLGLLNARTRHRFTGLFSARGGQLSAVALYDRENPALVLGDCVTRLERSYCARVLASRRAFGVADAGMAPDLAAVAEGSGVLSYCGVPVIDAAGHAVGTLCHFDPRPRLVPRAELPVMWEVAAQLARWVVVAAPPAPVVRTSEWAAGAAVSPAERR